MELSTCHPHIKKEKYFDNTTNMFEANRCSTRHQVIGTHRYLKSSRINSAVHNIGHRGTQRGIESLHVGIHDMRRPFRKIFKVMASQNG
jgi:hypothetical protein